MTERTIERVIAAADTSDGAGVHIRRSLGQRQDIRMDPFLMLDEFGSENPDDYVAGFPSHPHRGFETVTYMIEGHMLHSDHLGNQGHLKNGGVQWMTAGRGVIHSEMPEQEAGTMRGFQLWLNLPAAEKMRKPGYWDFQPESLPTITAGEGRVILIAGHLEIDGEAYQGAVTDRSTQPVIADLQLAPEQPLSLKLPSDHNALLYLYEGEARVGDETVTAAAANLLSPGETLKIVSGGKGARVFLVAGKPIGEPVVQYGPFVMNSREEIEQALQDYRNGTLAL